jgi:enoyl-CoA hydratase/carnithine racemase
VALEQFEADLPTDDPNLVASLVRTKRESAQAVADRMEEERRLFQSRLSSAEAKEAITAFLEKRAPDFSRLG